MLRRLWKAPRFNHYIVTPLVLCIVSAAIWTIIESAWPVSTKILMIVWPFTAGWAMTVHKIQRDTIRLLDDACRSYEKSVGILAETLQTMTNNCQSHEHTIKDLSQVLDFSMRSLGRVIQTSPANVTINPQRNPRYRNGEEPPA